MDIAAEQRNIYRTKWALKKELQRSGTIEDRKDV
jgi:hypothetical protein